MRAVVVWWRCRTSALPGKCGRSAHFVRSACTPNVLHSLGCLLGQSMDVQNFISHGVTEHRYAKKQKSSHGNRF